MIAVGDLGSGGGQLGWLVLGEDVVQLRERTGVLGDPLPDGHLCAQFAEPVSDDELNWLGGAGRRGRCCSQGTP